MKKPFCMGDLSPAHKIFIESPEEASHVLSIEPSGNKVSTAIKCFILPQDNWACSWSNDGATPYLIKRCP